MDSGRRLPPLSALDKGLRGSNRFFENSLQSELNSILQEQRNQLIGNQERDPNICRSGSAPPTVEGSLSAVGSLFGTQPEQSVNSSSKDNSILSEEEIRSHPAYLQYYYSHEHLNPRLPPPLLSKEDWRVAQRFQAGGSRIGPSGDWGKENVNDCDGSSLFSMQPGPFVTKAENDLMELAKVGGRNAPRETASEWVDSLDGLTGCSGTGLGARRKSFADIVLEGLGQSSSLSVSSHPSCPASCNSFANLVDRSGIHNSKESSCNGVESLNGFYSGATPPRMVSLPSHGTTLPHSFPAAVGSSLSRSKTPESHLFSSSSGCVMPMGSNTSATEKNCIGYSINHGHSSSMPNLADITTGLSGVNLPNIRNADGDNPAKYQFERNIANQSGGSFPRPGGQNLCLQQNFINNSCPEKHSSSTNYVSLAGENGMMTDHNASEISYNRRASTPNRAFSSPSLCSKAKTAGSGSLEGSNFYYQNGSSPDSAWAAGGDGDKLHKIRHRVGPSIQSEIADPEYTQYRQRISDYVTQAGPILGDSSRFKNYYHANYGHLAECQRAYLESLLAQQKQQYQLSLLDKFSGLSHAYSGNKKYGIGMPYPGNLMENSIVQNVGFGSPMFQNEHFSHSTPVIRSSMGGRTGSWSLDTGSNGERISSSLLDEFKNNKNRPFELSNIADHVAEFSMDQYGSRFIQQKLETATVEEMTKIFHEIIPHARTLMTDVFGNYVVQKLFEYGTGSQRKELANQLKGHVLPLSLQMYGCRVIQKALEVFDVDQKTQMVAELDGSIMRCVRDQNANHVIQKCIECVPQDRIQFIISAFYGQVVPLSTHPYGCRVIQRVLEHCDDPDAQKIIMNEIMQSVSVLAQDQYGNYVIQHVLEHGKTHERSAIISKLTGQIVSMSQQKFASNVVEKCLTFGSPEERQLLLEEILGSSDENDPLEGLMKDPFGNYVVQKVLETCDDQSLELILSRIKAHLNSLKRYTFGKHIVSRAEKLIMTGGDGSTIIMPVLPYVLKDLLTMTLVTEKRIQLSASSS